MSNKESIYTGKGKSYLCPFCGVVSQFKTSTNTIYFNDGTYISSEHYISNLNDVGNIEIMTCSNCYKFLIVYNNEIIYPSMSSAPMPNEEMPENVKEIYNEAREVYNKSPKAAAALLRLSLQLLCKELGGEGKNINNDIKIMVKNGLPPILQKSLDILRVIGNEAVYPGTIDFNDNQEVSLSLFNIMNFIVEKMIIEPKQIKELYDSLPEDKLKAIENRDK